MKLHTKILLIALLPILILGIGIFLLAVDRTANGIYDESYEGMKAASLAIRDIFEVGNEGKYEMDKEGNLWKGTTLNITGATEIVDHIKSNTGMDVTIFWGDTRILTSIENEVGERQINTKASEKVIEKVLNNGEIYLNKNTEILGKEYIVCYTPFYQEGTKEVVGMVCLGKPRSNVEKIIGDIRLQMFMVIFFVMVITSVIVIRLVNKIVKALNSSIQLLRKISEGELRLEVDEVILKRSDEIGMLGRGISELRRKFRDIIDILRNKSHELDEESIGLKQLSENILAVVKQVEQAAREMAGSCSNQAEDASIASSNVTTMGEMMGNNNVEIKKMHTISNQIQTVSKMTREELSELDKDMGMVKKSIDYLGKQTRETKASVDKIGNATEMIAEIASQTSLLSLNASIESARAGEQGKSFGIVASEIQKLSEQANTAVEDIRDMIENLTLNSNQTMQRMEQVQLVIKDQEENIKKTGVVFENVQSGIKESANHMDMVMEKSEELEEVRTDIIAAVQNSAAIAEENAASIEAVMTSIENVYKELGVISGKTTYLGTLSTEMKESIHIFLV